MRVVIGTSQYEAVGFNVPVAELTRGRDLERNPAVGTLGPDILAEEFDAADAAHRIARTPDVDIAEALLGQQTVAGIGNIFKCEALYASGLDPFARVADHRQIWHRRCERFGKQSAARRRRRIRIAVHGYRGWSAAWRSGFEDKPARVESARAGHPCRLPTSGQIGTHSTSAVSSATAGLNLLVPSYRTSSPSRQREMPTRGFTSASRRARDPG